MFSKFYKLAWLVALILAITVLATGCGFKRKKYENPITKDTQQPDKELFDKSVKDIEKGRYEIARITLNTLINTYDTSEFLAKAKLAIADSWFREGGTHGLAQAEAEYKDFQLFYPNMEEAAESQEKICLIHYRQMQKADRDPNDALRAELECKEVALRFPNSKFAPQVQQLLREVQEVLAEAEMAVGEFYHGKGSWAASANRLKGLTDHYTLFSGADQALWLQGDSYTHMGPAFRQSAGEAYAKIVKDYPLSPLVAEAKKKLTSLEVPVPEADPTAVARMKFEQENTRRPGMIRRATGFIRTTPDVSAAAKSGTPQMDNPKQSIPASVPVPAAAGAFSGDVTIAPVTGPSALDTAPDARAAGAPATAPAKPAPNDSKGKNTKK